MRITDIATTGVNIDNTFKPFVMMPSKPNMVTDLQSAGFAVSGGGFVSVLSLHARSLLL